MDSYSRDSSCSTQNNYSDEFVESRENSRKAKASYHWALHSIRRPLQAKTMTKKPIAPLPPTPPKIYQVESSNFKQVVQKLTSVPEFHPRPRRLQKMAPPPLNLLPNTTARDNNIIQDDQQTKFSDFYGLVTPTMSPASLAWCSFLLQSPGTSTSLHT